MAAATSFNNVILGQFVLTGVPIKIYTSGRFLTLTDTDDIEDPRIGFGIDEAGEMIQFSYPEVEFLQVSGNKIDITAYNTGMAALHGGEEAPADKEPEEEEESSMEDHYMPKLSTLIEVSQEEVDAEIEGSNAAMDAAKAKLKAAQASMKNTMKTSKEKIKAAKSQPIDDGVNPLDDFDGNNELYDLVSGMAIDAYGALAADIPLEDQNDPNAMKDWIYSLNDVEAGQMIRRIKNKDFGLYESHEGDYTFGTGDIVNDKDPGCQHFGSKGIIIQIPNEGTIRYTVTNGGDADQYKPGDILTKHKKQLEKI